MVFILIVVLLVLLGFLVWGWDRVDLRDAQGRLLNRKIQLKSADEGSLIGLAYGVYTFEIWHRGILQWKPRLVKRIIVEHDKLPRPTGALSRKCGNFLRLLVKKTLQVGKCLTLAADSILKF